MFEEVTITIDGTYSGTYYVPADRVEYISDNLINTGSSTIYLYKSLTNHDEYIRLNTYSAPEYHRGYNSSVIITDITEVTFSPSAQLFRYGDYINLLLLMFIVISSLWRFLKND